MSDDTIDVSGISKAALLAALYNASKQQGMGFMDARGGLPMTEQQAAEQLERSPSGYFDYLHGRVMKLKINGETLSPWLYDRDNGRGAAARVVEQLRQRVES